MALPYRPLGAVKQLLEQIGLEVTYAYDDLVFLMHNPVLLQFGEVGEMLFFHVNVETSDDEAQHLFAAIQAAAAGQGITLLQRGKYRLSAGEDENLSLEFLDDAALQ
jgi:alpha-D-ribose 1-methylphosphonate 5-triphosphate synthase subunit PhnH